MKIRHAKMMLMLFCMTPISAWNQGNWFKTLFKQAQTSKINLVSARCYLRSIAVYDYFATVTLLDALMVTPEVLATYAELYAERRGWSCEQQQYFLACQEAQYEDMLAFYLLIKPARYGPTISATDPHACWIPTLQIEDTVYQPQLVKVVRLEPEYHYIFGKHFSPFREVYYLAFNLGQKNRDCVASNTVPVELTLRSAHYIVRLLW